MTIFARFIKAYTARFLLTLLIAVFSSALAAQESSEKRIALVIGNSAYQHVPSLKNPANDSNDLAQALRDIGFEVLLHTDQTQGDMLDTLRNFRRQSAGADIALIYFAGHGIEIDRQNYLIPVDAVLETDSDVNFETVRLDTLMFSAQGAKRLSMVIVDACRDNPFATTMQRTDSTRSVGRGLSSVEPTKNTLVAYAAKEGTTAADGVGRNSPYAGALITALKKPNLEIGLMMRQVRDDVLEATGGQQEPFVYGSLSADQVFLNNTRGLAMVTPSEKEDEPAKLVGAAEIAFWQSISQNPVVSELETYLQLYPDGHFASLARARIEALRETEVASVEPTEELVPERRLPDAEELERSLTRREIVEVQERLSALGYSLGSADGIAGRRTEAAIQKYAAAENISASGKADLPILLSLRETVSDGALADWRRKQAERARTSTKPRTQQATTTTTKPKTTTKPAETESAAAPKNNFAQFCSSNAKCATQQCNLGSASAPLWRKARACQFCPIYAERCQ